MLRRITGLAACVVALAVGCGGESESGKGANVPTKGSVKGADGTYVKEATKNEFLAALQAFADADAKGTWTEEACKKIAADFKSVSSKHESNSDSGLAEALYNSGLALMRCGLEQEGRDAFQAAVNANSKFHQARTQLALFEYQKGQNLESTVSTLEEIIRDAQFQSVEALVALAALQMERGSDQPNSDGKDDLERAQRNLQRALAIDDGYMPAFNQLAIYYLEQAKAKSEKSGTKKRRRGGLVVSGAAGNEVNAQMLDLAALVASQAMRKNQKYAPIHNTSGLIQVELRNFNGAVKSFAAARSLDKDFFEAQMNYAAVNLSFRGFSEAEKAYREAIRLKPNEYDAHLGLALAIRGQINMGNKDKLLPMAEKSLAEAKRIAGDRPETYYNESILTQEFKSKGISDIKKSIEMMRTAIRQYEDFVSKAGSDEAFAPAVKRSKERIQDMEDTIKFLELGEEERKKAEAAPPPPPPAPEGTQPPADGQAPPADGAAKPADAAAKPAEPAPAAEKKK